MDFYASKNPDKPIEDVFLTGDGALIKGIDGLFKVQLNVSTRIMDTLYNMKFDSSIDLKVYNPVYLVTPIGAAFAPMGFNPSANARKASSGGNGMAIYVAIVLIAAIASAFMAYYSITEKNKAQERQDKLEADIERIKDIELVVQRLENSRLVLQDVENMYNSTYHLNENARSFISQLEEKIPKTVVITGFSSSDNGFNIPAVTTNYDSIAEFIMQLKTIDCVADAYCSGWTKSEDELGQITFTFNITAKYVQPVVEGAEVTDETETTEEVAE